ncbi:hypothetical protein Tco_1530311, partial [Tanacetum coccineum]
SSAEAEYVAVAGCCANILWMKSPLTDYDIIYEKVPIFCDNTSAIAISNNSVLHSRTKHIDIRYHFIRDHILKGDIELHFIPTQYQLADIFTKPLDEPTFKRLIVELDQVEFTFDEITFTTNMRRLEDIGIYSYKRNNGDIGITTLRNALRAHYLLHSSEYVSPPSLEVVRPWFQMIRYNGEIGAKGTLKKSCLPPRWRLMMAQIIHYLGGKTGGLDQISNKDATILYCLANGVQVDFAKIIWEDIIHKLNKKTREKVVPYPSFFHFHSESASECDASADSTTGGDPVKSAPNDSIPSQQGMDEGTKNYSIDHIFAGTNPSVLVDMTKSARDGLKTAHTELGTNKESDEISKKIKLEDLSDLMQDTRSAFLTPDSPQDETIIVLDESKEEEIERYENTHTTYHDGPKGTSISHPPSLKSAQIQELMAQALYDINQLTELLVTSLKPKLSKLLASHDFASCLPTELKELPLKITELSGDVQELKKHVQNMFSSVVKNASGATGALPAEGEKNTYPATKEANLKNDLVDLMGIDVVEEYHKKKILYDKYCDKMLKIMKSPKITNCDVLTKKGPMTLKVYREDRMDEVISNFKVNDLHLAKWREVVQACPDRKEKG